LNTSAGLLECRLQLLSVFECLHPPAHVGKQLIETSEQPIAYHRVQALAVVVHHPPEVAHIVLPTFQQGLEHIALVQLGVAHQRHHAALAGLVVPRPHVVLHQARTEPVEKSTSSASLVRDG
jgi:hypothetical protein